MSSLFNALRQFTVTSCGVLLFTLALHAQNDIENVRVETYYVADGNDATDTVGGGLEIGSRTYRIYIDLAEGRSLRALYGREGHPLNISSTEPIFNHLDRGKRYGHEVNNSALDEGVVALDSWLSLGAASNQRSGIRKEIDPDGSILGGMNNDGGSAAVVGGLLNNTAAEMGIPLTVQDGLMTSESGTVPPNFLVTGEDPRAAFADSTLTNAFVSEDFSMGCSTPGIMGNQWTNEVLVAQITTTGELAFSLNIELELANGVLVRYVSADTLLEDGETANGLLTYPQQCGCMDPDFLEYDPAAGCDDGSCATTIVFGCLDMLACNYDPAANFNIEQLCCYGPGDCNGLDISLLCPDVSVEGPTDPTSVLVAPNPIEHGRIRFTTPTQQWDHYVVTDITGRVLMSERPLSAITEIDASALPTGIHVLSASRGTIMLRQVIIIP